MPHIQTSHVMFSTEKVAGQGLWLTDRTVRPSVAPPCKIHSFMSFLVIESSNVSIQPMSLLNSTVWQLYILLHAISNVLGLTTIKGTGKKEHEQPSMHTYHTEVRKGLRYKWEALAKFLYVRCERNGHTDIDDFESVTENKRGRENGTGVCSVQRKWVQN